MTINSKCQDRDSPNVLTGRQLKIIHPTTSFDIKMRSLVTFRDVQRRMVVARGWESHALLLTGYEVSLWEDGTALEMDGDDDCRIA